MNARDDGAAQRAEMAGDTEATPRADLHAVVSRRERLAQACAEQEEAIASGEIKDDSAPIDFLSAPRAAPLTRDLFPPIIADYAWPLALASGHDPGAYALSMMCAMAGAATDDIRVCLSSVTDYYERARLWTGAMGKGSSAKTPALNAARGPINQVQTRLSLAFKDALKSYNAAHRGKKDPRAEKFSDPAPEGVPTQEIIIVDDVTIEAMSGALECNPRGILVHTAELDQLIGGMDAYRASGASARDRGYWLSLYDGGPLNILRVQRGALFVPNWGASVMTAGTITALQRHAKNLKPDGLLARFLLLLTAEDKVPDRTIKQEVIEKARVKYIERVEELLQDHRPEVATARLDADAQAVFDQFKDRLPGLRNATEEVSQGLGAHVGKGAGHLGKLALTAHLAQYGLAGVGQKINGEDMRRAQRLLEALWKHASVVHLELMGGGSAAYALAVALAKSILADGKSTLRRADMAKGCRAWRDEGDERVRRGALEILMDMDWVKPVDGRAYRGEVTTWQVHPSLHGMFSKQAEEHRELRRVVRQKIIGE